MKYQISAEYCEVICNHHGYFLEPGWETIVLTFRRPEQKDAFLRRNAISVHDQPLALYDADHPLTFVQVFNVPHELPDTTFISRLSKYCEVISNHRGYFWEPGWETVQDGIRHFRVRLRSPIPSFFTVWTIFSSCSLQWTNKNLSSLSPTWSSC